MIISSPGLKAEVEETICNAYHSDHWFYEINNPLMFIDYCKAEEQKFKARFCLYEFTSNGSFCFLLVLFKCKFNMFLKHVYMRSPMMVFKHSPSLGKHKELINRHYWKSRK
jgi:hypothetical protein